MMFDGSFVGFIGGLEYNDDLSYWSFIYFLDWKRTPSYRTCEIPFIRDEAITFKFFGELMNYLVSSYEIWVGTFVKCCLF